MANTELSAALARKVDRLIRLFNETPVMTPTERKRLHRRHWRKIRSKMFDEGETFHEAAGTPDRFNQSEQEFRALIRDTDQDLDWQCSTVWKDFVRYRRTGETPPPYHPMRVAILLRKTGETEREKAFLAAWCRHFPESSGGKFTKLVVRAEKTGAIPPKRDRSD